MGDALVDLERVLRSKKEQLSLQEANVLLTCRAKAMRDFTVGFGGGSIVTWLATQRLGSLGTPFRFSLAIGNAAVCGFWRFGKSCEASIEHILSMEGSEMQGILGNILLKRYNNVPWVQQCLSKHFYPEEVYDDSSEDKPVLRWRFRNYYGYPPRHSEDASYGEKIDSENTDVKMTTSTARTNTELNQVHVSASNKQVNVRESNKQVNVNSTNNAEDVFHTIFGFRRSSESNVPDPSISNPGTSIPNQSSRRKTRREKRAQRRRRRNHEEESEI